MKQLTLIFALLLFLSCEKEIHFTNDDFQTNFTESEILCLNAGNSLNPGFVQLYFSRKNEIIDLMFTSGLGIKKLIKFNSEIFAITKNSVLKFNSECSAIDRLYGITEYDDVKFNGNYFYFYSKYRNNITVINIIDGSFIDSIELDFELVDFEFGINELYLLSIDSLFVVSLNTFEQTDNALLYGACKDIELLDDFNAYVVSKAVSNEVMLRITLNNLNIVGLFQLQRGHRLKKIEIDQEKNFITYITNNAHFYHGIASDLTSNFLFINKPFQDVKSFVYTSFNDFVMVDDKFGSGKGRLYQYSFYGPQISEITVGHNPVQLLLID